jgi:hypothetical protein
MQGAQTLSLMVDELTATGVRVQFVDARSSVRERLRREGLDTKLGGISRGMTISDAVASLDGV